MDSELTSILFVVLFLRCDQRVTSRLAEPNGDGSSRMTAY